MIFFVAMPLITGLINIAVPLQIGARDMAFPVMNQVSLGLTTAGAALVMVSLVVGQVSPPADGPPIHPIPGRPSTPA